MRIKKPILLTLIIILAVAIFTGCNEPNNDMKNGEDVGNSKKFALFMSHTGSAFTKELSDAAKEEAEKLNIELTVFDGSNDITKQIGQVKTAVSQGIDGMMIEAVSPEGITPAIDAAKEAGIPVVIVHQKVKQQQDVSSFVGISHEEGGELQMTKVLQDIGSKGNIAMLLSSQESDMQQGHYAGYQKVLKDKKDIEVVFTESANGDKDEAYKHTESWLKADKQIHAIVAQNGEMALGALEAVKNTEYESKINVYAITAAPEVLQAIYDGKLKATVSLSPKDQGKKAMKTCYKAGIGENVESEIMIDHSLVTMDNVEDLIKE